MEKIKNGKNVLKIMVGVGIVMLVLGFLCYSITKINTATQKQVAQIVSDCEETLNKGISYDTTSYYDAAKVELGIHQTKVGNTITWYGMKDEVEFKFDSQEDMQLAVQEKAEEIKKARIQERKDKNHKICQKLETK